MEGNEACLCNLLMIFIYLSVPSTHVSVSAVRLATTNDIHIIVDGTIYFEIIEPESISYTYKIKPSTDFGAPFTRMMRLVELKVAEPNNACSPLTNNVQGAVVLLFRGACSFVTKTYNAEEAGALAVIVADNDLDNDHVFISMIEDETKRIPTIPSSFLLGKDGAMIKSELEKLNLDKAIINIPVNITNILPHKAKHPPWTLW